MSQKHYFSEINIMRGLAVLCVVIGHSFDATAHPTILGFLKSFVYCFHMPAFFFISGFLGQKKEELSFQEKCKKIRHKAKRLLIPYFFLTMISVALKMVFGMLARNPLNYDTLFIDVLVGRNNPNGGLWFLYGLFGISIIGILLCRMNTWILFWGSFLIYILNSAVFHQSGQIVGFIFSYSWYFFAGASIREVYIDLKRRMKQIPRTFLVVCQLLISVAFVFITFIYTYLIHIWLLFALVSVMGIFFLFVNANEICKSQGRLNRYLSILGNYGMDIYMIGYYVQQSIYVILGKVLGFDYSVYAWLMLVCGLILPILLSKYIVRKSRILSLLILGQ